LFDLFTFVVHNAMGSIFPHELISTCANVQSYTIITYPHHIHVLEENNLCLNIQRHIGNEHVVILVMSLLCITLSVV